MRFTIFFLSRMSPPVHEDLTNVRSGVNKSLKFHKMNDKPDVELASLALASEAQVALLPRVLLALAGHVSTLTFAFSQEAQMKK